MALYATARLFLNQPGLVTHDSRRTTPAVLPPRVGGCRSPGCRSRRGPNHRSAGGPPLQRAATSSVGNAVRIPRSAARYRPSGTRGLEARRETRSVVLV